MPFLDDKDYCSNYVLIFFHANAEDLGLSYDLAYDIRSELRINVIMMEYAGYGLYNDLKEPSAY